MSAEYVILTLRVSPPEHKLTLLPTTTPDVAQADNDTHGASDSLSDRLSDSICVLRAALFKQAELICELRAELESATARAATAQGLVNYLAYRHRMSVPTRNFWGERS